MRVVDTGMSSGSAERHFTKSDADAGGAQAAFLDRRRNEVWLLAILALALARRLFELDELDVWVDEANGILTAKQSLSNMLEMLRHDSSPPLYYFLLHGWMGVFGDSPIAVRSLSVVSSLALIAAVYTVGVREISRRVGCWAAFLVAISPSQVAFSQQARMYTLLPLFALLSCWFLLRTLRGGGARDFAVCMACTSLALYTHNFAVYLSLVLAAMVLVSGQFVRRFWMWLLAVVVQVLVYAAWIPSLLEQIDNPDHYTWFVGLWKSYGLLGVLERSFRSFAPAGAFVMSAGGQDLPRSGVPALVAVGLACWGLVRLWLSRRDRSAVDTLWLPIALVVPIAASLVASQLMTPHYVPGRVDQMLLPFCALLMAMGVAGMPLAWLRGAIAVTFLALSLVGNVSYVDADQEIPALRGHDSDMARAIVARWRPNDVILCTSLTRAPLEYYLGRAGIEANILSFPRDTAHHLGSQNEWRLILYPDAMIQEAKAVLDEARRLSQPDGRLFLLRSDIKVNAPLMPNSLRTRFQVVPRRNMGNYLQIGTGHVITLSLNRMIAPRQADTVP